MLAEDGRGCRDYDGYLLYSERTILKSVHLSDENNLNAPIKPFEDPEHMKNVIALTFDYRGGGGKGANRIFFSDIHFGNIQRISDDGSDRKTVVESEYSHIFRLSKTHRVDIGPVISHNGLSAWFTPLIFEWITKNLSCKYQTPEIIWEELTAGSPQNTLGSFYSDVLTKLETKERAL